MSDRPIGMVARLTAAAAVATLLTIGATAVASAQTDTNGLRGDQAAAPKHKRDPKACAEPVMPGGQASRETSGEALGERLARTEGVLCPPAGIDPEMQKPAPDTGRIQVIPPPGSPGGDPTLRPK
jgi:hypothetical protein